MNIEKHIIDKNWELLNSSAWIAQYKAGNSVMFAELVRYYETRLLSFASHILGSDFYAKDIVSNVFYTTFHHREILDNQQAIRLFLYVKTRNFCLAELYRKELEKLSQPGVMYLMNDPQSIPGYSPKEEFLVRSDEEFDKLPVERRELLRKIFIHGKTVEEISSEMGTSIQETTRLLKDTFGILRNSVNTPDLPYRKEKKRKGWKKWNYY